MGELAENRLFIIGIKARTVSLAVLAFMLDSPTPSQISHAQITCLNPGQDPVVHFSFDPANAAIS